MLPTRGYATKDPKSAFEPFEFNRREVGPHDVLIQIQYCGICHSDIHQARDEWGGSIYPMVPGHEIVGKVMRIGSQVKKFKVDDIVGVGCFVESCRVCNSCKDHEEQFCEKHVVLTYNSTEMDLKTPTFGGYSSQIVVDENYVLSVSPKLPLANVAPLLCAGITTYSPLKHFNVKSGSRVGVIGLGGLGHMAVKIAAAMGAEVTVLSTSASKEQDARRLGASKFVVTKDPKNLASLANYFDFILDAVSAPHDLNMYLNLLNRGGVMVLVGVPEKPMEIQPFALIGKRRILAGSMIGGIRETQEMLDFCAKNNITSDIEIIPIQKIAEAYERTIKGDVRYRFVIDMSTLK
ncbi:MAG: NAD(P)-dependent alcohol dehydrogenase [Gammaproteobacteria bacterium]